MMQLGNKSIRCTKLTLISAFTPIVGLSVPNLVFAAWGDNMYGHSNGHMMGSGYMGWSMIIFWFLLLILLIFLIRWISRLSQSGDVTNQRVKTPLDILKERLANGEIEIDEYKEKKEYL